MNLAEYDRLVRAGNPVCPYCKQVAKVVCGAMTIFHLSSCIPSRSGYDKKTKTNTIEREMPGICHGGFL